MRHTGKSSPGVTVMGIDPGSLHCGYGIVSGSGNNPVYTASGRFSPPASRPLDQRLRYIYDALLDVIRSYRPDGVVVEKVFFAKSARAALSLGHARGVALLAAASLDVPVYERSALEVKKAVVGYGRAEKHQVEEMVKMILRIRGPLSPDSADALALALCHMNTLKFSEALRTAAGSSGSGKRQI